MSDTESPSRLRETSPQPGMPPPPAFPSGHWWWQRHLHVPVVVWIVASVLGGAAIGNALDASVRSDETPAITPTIAPTIANVDSDPGVAVECDANYAACVPVASDVDCVTTDTDIDAAGVDDDGPTYVAEPVAVVGEDVYDLDADHNGIGCD